MQDIKPYPARQEILCAEPAAPANAIVIFGASGDLAKRKLLPSLLQIYARELIADNFYIIGCGRKELSDEQFREIARLAGTAADRRISGKTIEAFTRKLYYVSGDYDSDSFYQALSGRLEELDKKHNVPRRRLFYLAVPPFLYQTIVDNLCRAHLSCPPDEQSKSNVKLVVEKPFGKDLQSAMQLDEKITSSFDESQIYRIDHYLGKETVQNILMFRFANAIFEPVWNRNYIDHIQITIAESLGIEHRGGYYDKSGALRDIFQSHMLGMLSLVAMEPPVSFEADAIRDEKVKLLKSIRPFEPDRLNECFVRGRYGPGSIEQRPVAGYTEEPDVQPNSKTETFVAAKLFIDNWRWKAVPFYLRTGKRLANKDTEIAITFKKVPHSMFVSAGLGDMPANILVLQIQPEEGITLSFQAKRPGSKVCITTLTMSFSYSTLFRTEAPQAYERLLLDCMAGDQTLFTRQDDVRVSWRLLTPVLEVWEKDGSVPHTYPAGAESFPAADEIIERDGRTWRKLNQP